MKNRSAIEIMVIGFSFVVGLVILGLGTAIVVVEIVEPESDTGVLANTLTAMVVGILGALLGLLANRSGADLHRRPDGDENGVAH